MKKEVIRKNSRKGFLLIVLFASILFVFALSSVLAQETIYCAERTVDGASCQNVPLEEVDTEFRHDRTSCESTSYCSIGTCVNRVTGECLPGPAATCDPNEGGSFFDEPKDEIDECRIGCCLLGDGASLVERTRCDALGNDYNVNPTFLPNVQDEGICLSMASPETKGACTFETDRGRSCEFVTRGECQERMVSDDSSTFHEDLLCTAVTDEGPISICSTTERTTCVEGKNEVYFIDSCGNIANVYDANKIDDVEYWSYVPGVEGVEVDIGDGQGNIGSPVYGACDYISGSTCGPGNAEYGNFICMDLGCSASELTGGVSRDHGEEWCSQSIDSFENGAPGDVSYLLYCYNGEVQYELCDPFRNKLCLENAETQSASCVVNEWQGCSDPEIETTDECLNAGDCRVLEGASLSYLRTQYGVEKSLLDSDTGEEIKAACVPKYSPGFKFWDPEGTLLDTNDGENPLSICEFASVSCFVPYTQEIIGVTPFRATPSDECIEVCKETEGWDEAKCFESCTPVCLQESFDALSPNTPVSVNEDWAESYQGLCTSLGDCGVAGNYLGQEGYNSWRDLFRGKKINWNSLINAEDRE